jgi:hypothetical protein
MNFRKQTWIRVLSLIAVLTLGLGAFADPIALKVTMSSHSVRFSVQGAVQEFRVEILSLTGQKIFDSGSVSGAMWSWPMLNREGRPVANGVYLYSVTLVDQSRRVTRKLGKAAVLRGKPTSSQLLPASQSVQPSQTPSPPSIESLLDTDQDNRIGDLEILRALDFWVKNQELTPNLRIDDLKILQLLDIWIKGTALQSDTTKPPEPPPGPGPAPEPIPGPTLEGQPVLIDDVFVGIARQVPGFGGMFIKDNILHIYLTDPSQRAAAEAVIASFFGRERIPAGGIKVLQGKYDFLKLKGWHDRQRFVTLALPGVISTSISESENRLKVRVDSQDKIAQVEQKLSQLGVPREMVNIIVDKPVDPLQKLTDTQRPLLGGIQIQNGGGGTCTLGFLAVRNGVAGFVTNSHCMVAQGGLLGTVIHQATVGDGTNNRIGAEMIDPQYVAGLEGLVAGSECPSGRQCRLSDSAFVRRDSGPSQSVPAVWANFGTIALPYPPSQGLAFDGDLVKIRKEHIFAIEGDFLSKVGRTTGYTAGEVIETCEDVNQNGSNFTILCQYRVEAVSNKGDSGSPVFTWSSALLPPGAFPSAELYGILWGGNGDEFVFSPMFNIEFELGSLKTRWDEPGANSPPEVKIMKPADGSSAALGGLNIVTFQATVEDYEDGDYYDGSCDFCEVKWSSDKEGSMGGGKVLEYVFTKSGTHTITATAKDKDGATSAFSIKVTVGGNTPPGVTIEKPTQNQNLYKGVPYVFDSSSWDMESFSPLPCSSLTWTSNNAGDPFPVTGCQPSVTFTTTGTRTITLTGKDSQGATGTDTVTINVVNPPASGPPLVTILNPKNGTGLAPDKVVTLKGKATDPDGKSPLSYKWVLKKHPLGFLEGGANEIVLVTGAMQSGAETTFKWKPSDHVPFDCGGNSVRIYLEATDPDGQTGSTIIDVGVDYPPC